MVLLYNVIQILALPYFNALIASLIVDPNGSCVRATLINVDYLWDSIAI
ncbi:MAG: hypothetical protein ACJA0Q_002124 [Saprospiraceae bacterium]|jgi:hypothetical protein